MKFIIVLMVCYLSLSTKGYTQTITLNVKNASFEQMFKEIYRQSGYHFFYRYKEIIAQSVSIKLKNASLEETLIRCFQNKPFIYKIEGETITVGKKRGGSESNVYPQKNTTSELLKDGKNQPSPGIRIKDKAGGSIIDRDGIFKISADPNAILIISSMGGKTKEETLNNQALN